MNVPTDNFLYKKIKKKIYKKIPKHSAYRSGLLVQSYKKAFSKKYGKKKQPYTGKKTKKRGLKRWFKEKWVNQRGEIGYKYKSDIYRPSRRITKKTPTTHKELSKREIKRARKEKYTKGRVKKFKKKKRTTQKRNQRAGFFGMLKKNIKETGEMIDIKTSTKNESLVCNVCGNKKFTTKTSMLRGGRVASAFDAEWFFDHKAKIAICDSCSSITWFWDPKVIYKKIGTVDESKKSK